MSRLCAKCMNHLMDLNYKESQYALSKNFVVCENCGEICRFVIATRKDYRLYKLRFIINPIVLIWLNIRAWFKPLTIYKYSKKKKPKA